MSRVFLVGLGVVKRGAENSGLRGTPTRSASFPVREFQRTLDNNYTSNLEKRRPINFLSDAGQEQLTDNFQLCTYHSAENKHKQYITAFVLHNSYTYGDGSLFSDLLFWLPHQINSVNNSHHDCGGGCLFRAACHVAMEPRGSVCSKNGNVYYLPLPVECDFI